MKLSFDGSAQEPDKPGNLNGLAPNRRDCSRSMVIASTFSRHGASCRIGLRRACNAVPSSSNVRSRNDDAQSASACCDPDPGVRRFGGGERRWTRSGATRGTSPRSRGLTPQGFSSRRVAGVVPVQECYNIRYASPMYSCAPRWRGLSSIERL